MMSFPPFTIILVATVTVIVFIVFMISKMKKVKNSSSIMWYFYAEDDENCENTLYGPFTRKEMRDKFLKGILQKNTNIGNNRKGEEFKRLEELFYPVKNAFLKKNEIQTMKGVDTTAQHHQTGEIKIDIKKLLKKLQKILPILIEKGVDYRHEILQEDYEGSWNITNDSFKKFFTTFFNPDNNFTQDEIDTLCKICNNKTLEEINTVTILREKGAQAEINTYFNICNKESLEDEFYYLYFLSILQIDFNIIQNLEQLFKYIHYKLLEENIRNSNFSKIFSMEEPIRETLKLNKEDFKKWLADGEISDEQYTKLFQTINVKGDNEISYKELRAFFFDPNYERDVQPKLDKMFPNTFSEDKMKKSLPRLG